MIYIQVLVSHNKNFYQCQNTRTGWKCGKCGRGLINPNFIAKLFPDKCKVCQAVVAVVRFKEFPEESSLFHMKEYRYPLNSTRI